ncbi:hypothetical protein ABKV19_004913 [Rosa sericea]
MVISLVFSNQSQFNLSISPSTCSTPFYLFALPSSSSSSSSLSGKWARFRPNSLRFCAWKLTHSQSAWNVACQVAKLCRLMSFISFLFEILSRLFKKNFQSPSERCPLGLSIVRFHFHCPSGRV